MIDRSDNRTLDQLTVAELKELIRVELRVARAQAAQSGFVGASAIAQMLDVKPDTVRKWHTREGLPALRVGSVLRFDPEQVRKWIASRITAPRSWSSLHAARLRKSEEEL